MSGLFEGYEIHNPPFGEADARELARDLFGRDGDAAELGSHQDRNFLITSPAGERSVLRIANPHFGHDALMMQNAAMHHVAAAGVPFATPLPVPALDGAEIVPVTRQGEPFDVRMTTWVEGEPVTSCRYLDPDLRRSVGAIAAEVAAALADFDHAAADRVLQWDVRQARDVVDGLVRHVADPARRELVERAMAAHDAAMERLSPALRMQVIHGDVTDLNVVGHRGRDGRLTATGLIDFGDMTRSYLAAEPAVAAASLVWRVPDDALATLVDVVAAFHRRLPLTEEDLAAVFPLVLARCAGGAVSTDQQASIDPENRYANDAIELDWGSLAAVAEIPPPLAEAAFRAACGLEPHRLGAAVGRHLTSLRPVPPIDPAGRGQATCDLSAAAAAYAHGEWSRPEGVRAAVAAAGAGLAIGRYGEPRLHRSGDPAPLPPATVHLGADVFAEPGEPVRCPLAGTVSAVGDRAVTVRCQLPDGEPFWLLLDGIVPSAAPGPVAAGDVVGTVAAARTRPLAHVHLQLALEPLDPLPEWSTPDLRGAWLGLCPDPSPLLGLDAAAPPPQRDRLLAQRRRALADAQELYYREPPQIVRGWRHRLFDADARPYLDMVNNVAVLGHSHPAVAAAGARALRLLNTNSRFLYDAMPRFAERLVELLPAPLERVFLVSTGSEANDLALRLARSFTGRSDVIATEGAYHGWTTATIAVSTSPYDNPQAALSPPPGLRVVPQANRYRGRLGDVADAGERYAEFVAEAASGAAAFICEPVLGNAGGVLAPPGYLKHAYRHVRAAGGVCIADEVQVSYGRLGEWFWAFQQQGVVPDIVTIAKATGNGHPVGAVITTAEIAAAFAESGSFFSSVGGSPLSCEIGIAVLDTIRDEGLQENARTVGDQLRAGLEQLAARHPLIGAVHGAGLYLGADLVRDRDTREPAKEEAYAVCERMRELGVIVQPTGDHENVLKIKPPLCIDAAGAELFLETLDRTLTDGW